MSLLASKGRQTQIHKKNKTDDDNNNHTHTESMWGARVERLQHLRVRLLRRLPGPARRPGRVAGLDLGGEGGAQGGGGGAVAAERVQVRHEGRLRRETRRDS